VKPEHLGLFLHEEFDLREDDTVEVVLHGGVCPVGGANVRLLDDANYALYCRQEPFRYHGGYAKESPVYLSAPYYGHWHVVVDLGGYAGTVGAAAWVLEDAT
jgi:hypothetical protein